ncbi:hypothetical protein C7U57_01410 [Pseudomonas sp. R9.37]|nr:hypothetical protein C7U57_01410 [Pseudomonas sp. R9.37]
MWERACSRRRCVRPLIQRLTHRIREQARSHTNPAPTGGFAVFKPSGFSRLQRCPAATHQPDARRTTHWSPRRRSH